MSALRSILPALTDLSRFIVLADAAAILKVDPSHLRRLCPKLQEQGLAFFIKGDGGHAGWQISKYYHPALVNPDDLDRDKIPDLCAYSLNEQHEALQKWQCVLRFRAAKVNAPGKWSEIEARLIAQLRADFPGLHVTRSTLHRWHRKAADARDSWKLIDRRGGDQRHKASDAAWEHFKSRFCHQNQPHARTCWKATKRWAEENGEPWCSYRSCLSNLNDRISPDIQAAARTPAAYRHSSEPYIKMASETWGAGECYVGDHHQLDVICRFGNSLGRPWLTAWMDARTRRIVGWVLTLNPNGTTILGAMRLALMDPANFFAVTSMVIDNGRDYDSWVFHGQSKSERRAKINLSVDEQAVRGIFPLLGITSHPCVPYNPNGKIIERFFRDVSGGCRVWDTFTGNSVGDKPERLNEVLASGKAPTFEEIRTWLAGFIDEHNASNDHQIDDLVDDNGKRLSPNDAMAQWCKTRRVLADPKVLDLLLQFWHKPVPVGRNGISIAINGKTLHYGAFDPALTRFKAPSRAERRLVNVSYDPADLRTIRVFDEGYRPVGIVAENELGGAGVGITREHVAEQQKRKAEYRRAIKAQFANSAVIGATDKDQIRSIAYEHERAGRREKQATDAGPSLAIVRTPLDGAARELDRALNRQQLRKVAVGAESLPDRFIYRSPAVADEED